MYARISELSNRPIVSLQTGEAVAWVTHPVLDPATLEVLAFKCDFQNRGRHWQLLMVGDIRQFAPDCIVIDSSDELAEPNDVVRLQAPLKRSYSPIGKHVVTDIGRKLGSVEDYTINLESSRIQKLYVRQSVLHAWIGNSLVIDRTQILDVAPDKIVVRDTTVKTPMLPTDPIPGTQP